MRNRRILIGLAPARWACEHYSPQMLTYNVPLPASSLRIADQAAPVLSRGQLEYG